MFYGRICLVASLVGVALATQTIPTSSPLIFYHGRWDNLPSSWWPGSGFKLSFKTPPTALVINVGNTASKPPIPVGVRFGDSGEYTTLNLTAGANALPLDTLLPTKSNFKWTKSPLTFDLVTQFETDIGRLELQSIVLDNRAKLTSYTPSPIVFEFIGDSLTAGYDNPRGSLDAYAFKVGEHFHAEHNQIAQSGICLATKDGGCWGNDRGMDVQYFQTENSAAQYLNGNVTTPWDFKKYRAKPTHVVIAIGTNDASNNVTSATFEATYIKFLKDLRGVYPMQPIFAMSPWGWPYDGGVSPYWQDETAAAVAAQHDRNTYLMNGLGWLPYSANGTYQYPDGHPTPLGHSIVAGKMVEWLEKWGLKCKHDH